MSSDAAPLRGAPPFELRVSGCGLRAASCELRAASCELRAASCELRAASCELRAASCELRAADLRLLRGLDLRHQAGDDLLVGGVELVAALLRGEDRVAGVEQQRLLLGDALAQLADL